MLGMLAQSLEFIKGVPPVLRVFIGLGIPFIAVVLLLPLANEVTWTLWNIPFLYLWMFLWFVLTSACLAICWFWFDRHRDETI